MGLPGISSSSPSHPHPVSLQHPFLGAVPLYKWGRERSPGELPEVYTDFNSTQWSSLANRTWGGPEMKL